MACAHWPSSMRARPRTSTCRSSGCWPPVAACRGGCTAWRRSGRACWSSPPRRRGGRIAADRSGLRAAEDDLVGSIVKLQAARGARRVGAPSRTAVVCPFKGLAFFEVGDAGFFFGRERLVAELVARVTGAPLLGIVGASGSGKSSALRAGLLAALAAGVLPGSERWEHAVLRPGEHPLRALEQATAAAPDHAGVLAVDQFEELFTDLPRRGGARGLRRRARGLRARRAPAHARGASRCAPTSTGAAPPIPSSRGCSAPTTSSSARCAATSCAARSSCRRAAPACASSRTSSTPSSRTSRASPGRCRCSRRRCWSCGSAATAARCGSPTTSTPAASDGAVARLAEQAYDAALARAAAGARGASSCAWRARARATPSCAAASTSPSSRASDVAEVLGCWPTSGWSRSATARSRSRTRRCCANGRGCATWLQEDAEARRLHQHLIRAAHDWAAAGRDRAELYRGARLAAALDWSARHEPELNALERDFLAASRAEAESESAAPAAGESPAARAAGRRRGAAALAVVAGAVAVSQRGQARDAAVTADAQRLGAEALTAIASTTRCCSRAPASTSTTPPPPAASCWRC